MDLLPFGAVTLSAGCSRNTLGACAAGMGNATAQRLAREGNPFITMVRKDTASVERAGDAIQARQTAVATVDGHKYAL